MGGNLYYRAGHSGTGANKLQNVKFITFLAPIAAGMIP